MKHILRCICHAILVFVLVLGSGFSMSKASSATSASTSENPETFAREAFSQLSKVYRSGSGAPELVARLNVALETMQEARLRRMTGDDAGAAALEERSLATISEIMKEIPAAQQRAQRELMDGIMIVVVSVPITVAASTSVFYVTLRTWRWYEKTRLLEMEVVEKKEEKD